VTLDDAAGGPPARTPDTGSVSDSQRERDLELEAKAAWLRRAYARRGPHQARLFSNPGQAAIVEERDARLDKMVAQVGRPVRDVLDVGCGDGATLGRLAGCRELDRAVGVDLLPERVARARAAWPSLEFHVADGTHLDFPDESFDVALAMTVFSSVMGEARAAILHEIGRVLRPGGGFVWYDMRRPSPRNPDVRPFSAREVRAALPGWTIRVEHLTVAPPIARRLGPATRRLYGTLARVPLLLTHEVGLASRPWARTPELDP
jgi:ubiquinone/menaquinone biosynthesis C-methylase UbiE